MKRQEKRQLLASLCELGLDGQHLTATNIWAALNLYKLPHSGFTGKALSGMEELAKWLISWETLDRANQWFTEQQTGWHADYYSGWIVPALPIYPNDVTAWLDGDSSYAGFWHNHLFRSAIGCLSKNGFSSKLSMDAENLDRAEQWLTGKKKQIIVVYSDLEKRLPSVYDGKYALNTLGDNLRRPKIRAYFFLREWFYSRNCRGVVADKLIPSMARLIWTWQKAAHLLFQTLIGDEKSPNAEMWRQWMAPLQIPIDNAAPVPRLTTMTTSEAAAALNRLIDFGTASNKKQLLKPFLDGNDRLPPGSLYSLIREMARQTLVADAIPRGTKLLTIVDHRALIEKVALDRWQALEKAYPKLLSEFRPFRGTVSAPDFMPRARGGEKVRACRIAKTISRHWRQMTDDWAENLCDCGILTQDNGKYRLGRLFVTGWPWPFPKN